jgi:hypothetical protein
VKLRLKSFSVQITSLLVPLYLFRVLEDFPRLRQSSLSNQNYMREKKSWTFIIYIFIYVFLVALGVDRQCLTLSRQALYHVSHLASNLPFFFFKKEYENIFLIHSVTSYFISLTFKMNSEEFGCGWCTLEMNLEDYIFVT